ncbi:MAG TPA: lipopolysaccharide kinase InaA family protein [Gemmatimonadaceae bacterium]|jgi:hypothetical protein
MADTIAPPGFVAFEAGEARIVCAPHVADAVREMLRAGTLYDYARHDPDVRSLTGRIAVYALTLPGGSERAVVRRNHHGGLIGGLRSDLFLPPTRAPRELRTSEKLRAQGVPTPAMLGYAVYRAAGGFRRADIMTREVPHAVDLSTPLKSESAGERVRALSAAACLIRELNEAGARHHDLNVKNVLLEPSEDLVPKALVLDVDRVTFGRKGADVLEQNLARLLRSARKWQTVHGAHVTDAELDEFAALVRNA